MFSLNKLQALFMRAKNLPDSKSWFPHLPLALVSALSGLMYLVPLIKDTLGWNFVSMLLVGDLWYLFDLNMWGVSQSAIGALLVIMSLGLIGRSRLAWATCVMVILISLLIQLTAAEKAMHWWRIMIDSSLLLLLISNYHHFDRHNIRFGTLFALNSLVVFMAYAVFGTYRLGDQFSPPITDLTSALYFMVVTLTSVGYGDITPSTMDARIFLISVIILGIIIVSVALGSTLVPAFINHLANITDRKKTMKRSNHYIIVGHTALATNTYHELISRGEKVTVILQSTPENSRYPDADIIIGDGSDVDTLKKAGGEEAKAILALLNDDSENAFVVLAAKELEGGIKTVAAVNDVKNMSRIRRVHPYLVIAPQVLGGELLTMALTGEKVDSSTIMQRLMGQAELVTEKKT